MTPESTGTGLFNAKLYVGHIPLIPGKEFKVPIQDEDEAALVLATLAAYDLFLEKEGIRGDYTNAQYIIDEVTGDYRTSVKGEERFEDRLNTIKGANDGI
jgi:hypothetical protein